MSLPQGILPVLVLKKIVILPGQTEVIKVSRQQNINAIEKAKEFTHDNHFWLVSVLQKSGQNQEQSPNPIQSDDLYRVGTLCRIESIKKETEGYFSITLKGFERVELNSFLINKETNLIQADITHYTKTQDTSDQTALALKKSIQELSLQILQIAPGHNDGLKKHIQSAEDLNYLVDLCLASFDFNIEIKQELLAQRSIKERSLKLLNILSEFKNNLDLQIEIQNKLHNKIGQAQREGILREHLKTIKEELGEGREGTDFENLRKKIESCGVTGANKEHLEKEFNRLQSMGSQSPESQMLRSYIEFAVDLPWQARTLPSEISIEQAEKILNQDHSGLEKVKKRILQHLAVMKLRQKQKGTLLLFVGPPGVGKTSLASSVAKTLGREFSRVSLGGVRDESDIRGHRRTYIGSMAGRILQALKRTRSKDSVLLLDEIDKMGRGFSGDPAAALLEVLDPEQNQNFTDHYLDMPFDLSEIIFIATANSLEGIPAPLLDRLEIIEIHSYTNFEKFSIAREHLLPQELLNFGIRPELFRITDVALMHLIQFYTREAGVRELRRCLEEILRYASLKIVSAEELDSDKKVVIEQISLEEILGIERYRLDEHDNNLSHGIATGLAWSPVGGSILYVESTAMKGTGNLTLTGQLGEVMQESAQIAKSLIRSHLEDLGSKVKFENYDFHLHVPSGATPKDGPSAGVAILTALASLVSQKRVRPFLAMSGEITLRGAVTPVGGIKEKVLAAHRSGMKEIILPLKNRADLKDIPESVKRDLVFHFVERVDEVLAIALELTNLKWSSSILSLAHFNLNQDQGLNTP